MKKLILGLVLLIGCVGLLQAATVKSYMPPAEVNKQSLDKEKATAGDKATAQLVEQKVRDACKLLEKEGSAAFPKFYGKNSPYLFSGTYIWIHDLNGLMRVHPVKPAMMSGKSLLFLKDKNGNAFFVGMNKIAREKGEGWYEYVWPKPGETEVSPKKSFVKLVKSKDGEELVVGCGIYSSDLAAE